MSWWESRDAICNWQWMNASIKVFATLTFFLQSEFYINFICINHPLMMAAIKSDWFPLRKKATSSFRNFRKQEGTAQLNGLHQMTKTGLVPKSSSARGNTSWQQQLMDNFRHGLIFIAAKQALHLKSWRKVKRYKRPKITAKESFWSSNVRMKNCIQELPPKAWRNFKSLPLTFDFCFS